MCRGRQRAGHGAECVDGGPIDAGESAPRGRDLHRVDDEPAADQRLERGDIVAFGQPVVDERVVETVGGSALGFDHGEGAVDDGFVALVECDHHAGRIARVVVAIRFDLVVEPEHRWRCSPAQDPPAGVECTGHVGEAPCAAALEGRRGVEAELCRAQHAERALGSDEDLSQVGTDRLAGMAAGTNERPIGEHDVEAGDDVLDLAVARRELPGAATGDPPADRRQRHRLRPVPGREPVRRAQLVLEVVAEHPAVDRGDQRRVVDVDEAGDAAHVEHHAAVHGHRRTRHARSPRSRRERDALGVADRSDRPHLVDRARSAHDGGQSADLVVERPRHRQWPPVAARFGEGRGVDGDVGTGAAQPFDDGLGDVDPRAVEVRGRGSGIAGEGDRGCRAVRSELERRAHLGPPAARSSSARWTVGSDAASRS